LYTYRYTVTTRMTPRLVYHLRALRVQGVKMSHNTVRILSRDRRAAVAVTTASFGAGQGRILLDDVHCTGNETSIMSCSHTPIGSNNCNHNEDAGVICTDSELFY